MQKPENYESEKAVNLGEGFEDLEPGGYVCVIKKVGIEMSANGNEMIILLFDIYEGEKKGFYKKQFEGDTRESKKWKGVFRQVTGGNSTKFFKGVITSIEKSNSGFVFDFDEQKLVGKLFGGLFGREEYFNIVKGEYRFSTKLFFVRDIDTIRSGKFEIPKDKLAERNQSPAQTPAGVLAPMDDDEELPF